MLKASFIFLALLAVALPSLSQQQQRKFTQRQDSGSCTETALLTPSPFLGTANEIIVLADGSIWEDMSYKYLYLYAYNPPVIICPGQGKIDLPPSSVPVKGRKSGVERLIDLVVG